MICYSRLMVRQEWRDGNVQSGVLCYQKIIEKGKGYICTSSFSIRCCEAKVIVLISACYAAYLLSQHYPTLFWLLNSTSSNTVLTVEFRTLRYLDMYAYILLLSWIILCLFWQLETKLKQEGEIERCTSCESVFHKPCFGRLTNCTCGALIGEEKTMAATNKLSRMASDLLGRKSSSVLPLGLLSGLFSRAKPDAMKAHQDSDTVILMGSLPSTSLWSPVFVMYHCILSW